MDTPLQDAARKTASLIRALSELDRTGSAKNLPAGTMGDCLEIAAESIEEIYESIGQVESLERRLA